MRSIIKIFTLCTGVVNYVDSIETSRTHAENLVQWLRGKGGIINSKVGLRENATMMGMFAEENIPKHELLMTIPYDCLITGGLPKVGDKVLEVQKNEGIKLPAKVTSVNSDLTFDIMYDIVTGIVNEESFDVDYKFIKNNKDESVNCDAVRALIDEIKLGSESTYSPYLTYLLDQNHTSKLPSDWSVAGKSLLLEVLGDQLPPHNIETTWHTECGNDIAEQLENKSTNFKIPPSWKNIFIPLFDMISHANGLWTNTVLKISLNSGVTIHASRNIETGEEIFIPYSHCTNCKETNIEYGVSHVLRDYGIVEEYPQRWFFPKLSLAFEIYKINENKFNEIKWIQTGPRESVQILKGQHKRLLELQTTKFASLNESMPKNEWDTMNHYLKALITAIEYATTTEFNLECNDDYNFDEYKDLEVIETPYQVMSFKHNTNKNDTCLYLRGIGQNRDNDVLQQCENYRPHYHEIFVHYAARFVNKVQRVIWVGGGDSMLLHEILKYPSLEFVVGLEIDQTVTRKSFKYFGTQPHWHNEKVKWWYGDASKSLLVIPKEYYGTFDMVLVDLSETVLSMSVCKKLDIISALGLLLKPDGVIVKNDEYFHQLSEIFENTVQVEVTIPVPNPFVCLLSLILASNKINFLAGFQKDHNVEALWQKHLKPLDNNDSMSHDIWYDYKKIPANSMTCKEQLDIENELRTESKSPGILMILEAEAVTLDIGQSNELSDILKQALENEGLNVINTFKYTLKGGDTKDQIFILFREGYVVARTWPYLQYCAFDIHLWSSFEKHESIKKSLLKVVGSSQVSSYRIVAGGMFGISTWDDDMKKRGPRFTQPCESEGADQKKPAATCETHDLIDFVIQKTMSIIPVDNFRVGVVCGDESQNCTSLDLVEKDKRVGDVLELRACSELLNLDACKNKLLRSLQRFTSIKEDSYHANADVQNSNNLEIGDRVKVMLGGHGNIYFGSIHYIKSDGALDILYENGTFEYGVSAKAVARLKENDILEEQKKLRAIIIDTSASKSIGPVLHAIFKSRRYREDFLSNNILIVVVTQELEATNWKNIFQQLVEDMAETDDEVFYAHVLFHMSETTLNLSLISSGDSLFSERLKKHVTSAIDESSSGLTSEIRRIARQYLVKSTNVAERFFSNDYDTHSSLAQWYSQQALGRQTIFQLEQFELVTRMLEEGDIINKGESVEVYSEDMDSWYTGVVESVDEDDYFYIKFIDGTEEDDVERYEIRKTFIDSSDVLLSVLDIQNAIQVVCSDIVAKESFDFTDIGDGSMHVVQWEEGGVIVSWDGRIHVNINLFTYNEGKDFHDNFVTQFEKQIPSLKVALHDTQPRGTGRVINFSDDVEAHVKPRWA